MEKKTYTPEEIAQIAPHYRGKAENFDPTRAAKKRSNRQKPAKRSQPKEGKPADGPSSLNPQPPSQEIFGINIIVYPINPREVFADNFSRLPYIANEVYHAYDVYEGKLDRTLAPAEMTYYATSLLWIRLIYVKAKMGREALTTAEQDIFEATMDKRFNVPQPLFNYLSQIGTITDKGGIMIELKVPPLPTARAGEFGGYHAANVNEQNHNMFEEVPCLGIAADVIMSLQSHTPGLVPTEPNYRIETPVGSHITRNLCGSRIAAAAYVRPEIITRLVGQGITADRFPEYVEHTRFCLHYIRQLSAIIGQLGAFRVEKVNFPSLTSDGGYTQFIRTYPEARQPKTKYWTEVSVVPKSNTKCTATVGASYVFGFQLYKEQRDGTDHTIAAEGWSCIAPTQNAPAPWEMPLTWMGNRNRNRHLPPGLYSELFRGLSKPQDLTTEDVVRRMIKTPR